MSKIEIVLTVSEHTAYDVCVKYYPALGYFQAYVNQGDYYEDHSAPTMDEAIVRLGTKLRSRALERRAQ